MGRPPGAKNIVRCLQTTFQSYIHRNNTCYLTSLLECLHQCVKFSKMDVQTQLTGPGLRDLLHHLSGRSDSSLKELTKGLEGAIYWTVDLKKLYRHGDFGNPGRVYSRLISDEGVPKSLRENFTFETISSYKCQKGHISGTKYAVLSAIMLMDYHASFSPDVSDVIDHFFNGRDGGPVDRPCPICSSSLRSE